MNNHYQLLVDAIKKSDNDKIKTVFAELDDDAIIKGCFRRSPDVDDDDLNCSLSKIGLVTLSLCFEHWEVKLQKPLSGKNKLLLMKNSKLPFYISDSKIVVFERETGILLKMVEDDIHNVIENIFPPR